MTPDEDDESDEENAFVIAPCKRCGLEIEDFGPVDDEWFCTECYPIADREWTKQELKRVQAELVRIQLLYDEETGLLNRTLRESVARERRLERALHESHRTEVDGLVARAAYVARLETALRLIADADMTDDYYQRLKSDGLIERPPAWGSPRSIALAALDVPTRKLIT